MNIEIDQLAFKWLNENQLSYDIWDKKYRWNNESFEEWLNRVSGNDEKIKQLIYDKKFLFGGRTLSNRGTGNGSLNNCYSSGYVGDHLEDIMQVNKDIALTFKAEGGQGISLSKIRPKGSLIKDRFETEGIVPFMEMFNKTTESIMQ
jgi:ribonucleoside-diphosphate reductase alpha chain